MNNDPKSETDPDTLLQSTRTQDCEESPRLIVVSGVMLGHQVPLGDTPVFVGRSSECALAVPHPSVSRQHCRIWLDEGRYLIEDLGSTNRTFVNGNAVTRAELRDGDQIMVGSNAIKFFVGSSAEAEYHHELIDLAICDGLTGFFNRRHFRALLDEEIDKARGSVGLSLLMLDLDHFKSINDRYGHPVGDQVLAGVARILRETAPAGAPIGRLGGEEFALVLCATGHDAAVAMAERLCQAVAAQPVHTSERPIDVTVSIGVASTGPEIAAAADLLRIADECLYSAKQAGRNRAC